MKHDVSKLPKWAQYKIETLEREVATLEEKLMVGPEDSDTFADPFLGFDRNNPKGRTGRPLGKGMRVRFELGPEYPEYIEAWTRDGVLQLMAGETIAIIPEASNAARVRVGRDLWKL
jgi:hypothetical protein